MTSTRPHTSSKRRANPRALGLIKEYLEHYQLNKTLDSFKIDVNNASFTVTDPVPADSSSALNTEVKISELLLLFSNGETAEFLTKFRALVPRETQLLDKNCILLTFDLHLHFLAYPLRGNASVKRFGVEHKVFVKYLEEVASQNTVIINSSHARFLCLGLASIAHTPLDNFMIKELLKPDWAEGVKERLGMFLREKAPSQATAPKLEQLLEGGSGAGDTKQMQQLEAKCIQYKSLYARQQREYYNVLGVATELVEALENAILGKGVHPSTIERCCGQLFQSDQSVSLQQLDFTRPGTASNLLRQSVQVAKEQAKLPPVDTVNHHGDDGAAAMATTVSQPPAPTVTETVTVLDISKIRGVLAAQGEVEEAAYLLQAIRWRITKSTTEVERRELLTHCINEDIFAQGDEVISTQILSKLLLPNSDTSVLENFTRLLHCVSALSDGCRYLASHAPLVQSLVNVMTTLPHDDVIRQVVLGALQTLSLTRVVQTQMLLETNIMDWLLTVLSDPDELSEYTLHHTAALLMNLCLRTRGRMYLADNPTQLFTVVEALMEHEASLVRESINGILFSALNMASIREKAKEVGLEESLKLLIGISPDETSHQLEFCLQQLCSPASPDDPEEGDSEDEEEEEDEQIDDNLDSLTMDLQLPETITDRPHRSGEELLCSEYLTDMKLKVHVDSLVITTPRSPDITPRVTSRDGPRESPRVTSHDSPRVARGNIKVISPVVKQSFGPDSDPNVRQDEAEYFTNPDDRPIKPGKGFAINPYP